MILRRIPAPLALLVFAVLGGAGCKNKDATPAGASVLGWDQKASTRPSFATATAGPTRSKDVVVSRTTTFAGTMVLRLHAETADVTFVEGGKEVKHTAPVKVSATVEDSGDLAIKGSCRGPDYPFMPPGPQPAPMELRCSFNGVKGDSNDILSVTISGDGSIKGDSGVIVK
jgi:hypothetical protein